jgi:sugar lactone lactonase YvrE
MDVLAMGFGLVESPRWHGGQLFFADWTAGEIRVVTGPGQTEVVVQHASLPLCFDFLPDGTLVLVSGPQQALLRLEADGSLATYADLAGVTEGGCNDIVVDGRGNAYVNNVGFDFAAGPPEGPTAPGYVVLVPADGSAPRRVADDLAFPNGMAVTADNATLVVAESYRSRLTAYDIADDGSLSGKRTWAELGADNPDGICLDATGAAWYADVPHQHCVRVREGGEVLDTVSLDRGGFACMLADEPELHAVTARWPGVEGMAEADWQGQVVRTHSPAGRGGWPGN